MFIDVHCHLDSVADIDKLITNAKKKSVTCMVAQGINQDTNRKTLELARQFPEIKAALGLYPIEALGMKEKAIEGEIAWIKEHAKEIVAIGEVGLDLKEDQEQFSKQQRVFGELIEIAKKIKKPIIVHSRKAELQTIIQLEQAKAKKVLMHCFSGKLSLAKRIADNGWYLSIPTSVKNSEHFQHVIRQTPIENLLCETDSPYLHPDREFPNEPANVVVSYGWIAKLKDMNLKDVERQIERNYKKLFG